MMMMMIGQGQPGLELDSQGKIEHHMRIVGAVAKKIALARNEEERRRVKEG
jgi:hypothetical protein